MTRHHVIQVSDLHLSAARGYNQPGWEACLAHIAVERPDLVVATGDLVLDDPDEDADHDFARSELERIAAPWVTLPGNHDIGDANPAPYMGQHLDMKRLQRYLRTHGSDRWVRELGAWRLIGINAMLLGSGFAEEVEQEAWLRTTVAQDRTRPTALFLHKPLCIDRLDEADSSPDVCVLPDGRRRLLALLAGVNLRLVASGHTHHYRTLSSGGIAMVWAPSTAQILRMRRPFRALLRPGVVHYWFDGESLEYGLVEPHGMVANDVTETLARYQAMRYAPPRPVLGQAPAA
jgi:3',5'-cyclic AMP phosphodiesterase CpdA